MYKLNTKAFYMDSNIFSIINNAENDEMYRDQYEMEAITDQIKELVVDDTPVVIKPVIMLVKYFDPSNNVQDDEVRAKFISDRIYEETDLFTLPINTTNTVGGYYSNVKFHEEELIKKLIPDANVVVYSCNYGKLIYEGYTIPVPVRRTNRGRKKSQKKRKNRKKQGSGDEFNSQITFIICANLVDPSLKIIRPSDTKVYKFKIFRTGEIQLPGVQQQNINDVIECAKYICSILNRHLHQGECNMSATTQLININPTMKNYKFRIKLKAHQILDLEVFKTLLEGEQLANMYPSIFMVKYTRQDTKLSAKFSTPIHTDIKKKTRVNIFMRGKVNILGGFTNSVTWKICDYLHKLVAENFDKLVVNDGTTEEEVDYEKLFNIGNCHSLLQYWTTWMPPCGEITPQEYDGIIGLIEKCNDEMQNQ